MGKVLLDSDKIYITFDTLIDTEQIIFQIYSKIRLYLPPPKKIIFLDPRRSYELVS